MDAEVADVYAVDFDCPLLHIVEPWQKVGHCRFSRTGLPYEGYGCPGRDVEVYVVEDIDIVAVAECHVIIGDAPLELFYLFG